VGARGRASILLVDDVEDNLVALEAILEPLGQDLVRARSGEQALRELLRREIALILLDVQMPVLDGFETAELIKQRERTRSIPIIFLTAISKEEQHVFRGYEAGAVDYLFKPFDPEVLRSKVQVFIELHEKNRQLREQQELLAEQELDRLRRESDERYRFLAESIPQQVWTARPDGGLDYVNAQVLEYFARTQEEMTHWGWAGVLHPEDLQPSLARWKRSLETGEPYEVEFRLRRADGAYRWHLSRALALRGPEGEIVNWFGTNTDVDDSKRTERRQRFLLEAGAALGASLDYRRTLAAVAQLAVPDFADWCAVHVCDEDGQVRQLAVAHEDPRKVQLVHELQARYPADPLAPAGPVRVIKTGEPELVPVITDEMLAGAARDELHLQLVQELGLRSYVCVPLVVRGGTIGAIAFVQAESGVAYGEDDLQLAEELARRAATAVDNARLYRQAEERARAAQVVETVGDGVVLLDRDNVIRLWNPAAEAITGVPARETIGRRIEEIIPRWDEIAPRIPVAGEPGAPVPAETVPAEIGGRERWISGSGVGFEEGTVYAFRDLTEERALDTLKSDFVATVSHELRTPLAAIHGSAQTLLRPDLELDERLRAQLLNVVADESSRLAEIVNDLLLASRLDSGALDAHIESCDARELAASVVESAETHLPESIKLELEAPDELPPVAADRAQLRQVLVNLLDNAVKYSPEGGPVRLQVEAVEGKVRFRVSDRGLGIPASEQKRVFEKFYRLDPNMRSGIGGTGLGLYICRELVRRVSGKIWVESEEGRGSTFTVELPAAEAPARSRRPAGIGAA
jgi:PAS domain S-box-containing protein